MADRSFDLGACLASEVALQADLDQYRQNGRRQTLVMRKNDADLLRAMGRDEEAKHLEEEEHWIWTIISTVCLIGVVATCGVIIARAERKKEG